MDLQHLRASDGTGEAVLAHIQSVRNPGSTVLDLDNVDNWNSKAIVLTGTPAANGFISPVGMKVMYGHLNAGDFIIDGYAPGYADNGNTTAEVAIVKMTTNWADTLVDLLKQTLADNGKIKTDGIDSETMFADGVDPVKRTSEMFFDHVASGLVLTGDSYGVNRNASMTSGVVYINGRRLTVAAVNARTYTASKDTYVDILDAGNGTGTVVYTEVANNAASPALAANSVRVGIIITGATFIGNAGGVNQGQEDKYLPIISSNPLQFTDSLGNIICPRDPLRQVLSLKTRITQAVATSGTTVTELLDLAMIVKVPANRKIRVTLTAEDLYASVNNASAVATMWEGAVISGRQLQSYRGFQNGGSGTVGVGFSRTFTPLTSNPTIRIGLSSTAAGNATMDGVGVSPISATVELV